MTQREAFEAWYVKAYHHASLEQVENGCYLNLGAGMAWDAWTAAQAQAAVDPVNEWTVIAPDGTRFTGPTPLKAAFPASKYRLEIDPVAAAPSSICPAPLPRYALAINYPTLSGSR